ncbi:MAG: elongation factor G, partial [Planctomycetota bacterium]
FRGVIDLVHREALFYEEDTLGATYDIRDVPAEYEEDVELYREQIVDTLAEMVDWLADKYLGDEHISENDLLEAMREACVSGDVQPVLCGAALRNKGIQPLIDAVCDCLPAPSEVPPASGRHPKTGEQIQRAPVREEPFSGIVFKIQSEKHGDLFYVRVYSGTLEAGSRIYNANQEQMEHVTQLYRMHADDREKLDEAGPGSIVAAKGLKDSVTGDSLCDKHEPIIFERMRFPNTVVSMAIEPHSQAEKDKLDEALDELAREDPTFRAEVSQQTGQLLISGMGELHLDIIRDRLLREFNVDANVGEPRVSYRESLKEEVTVTETFDKEADGRGQFARVRMRFEPIDSPEGIEFDNQVSKDTLPLHFARAIERSLPQGATGPLFGYPLINVRAVLLDAETHPVDSTELAFEAAAVRALNEAMEEGEPQLLEPVMRLEIVVPENNMGDVISNVTTCRGEINKVESRDNLRVIRAEAPLAELFGFASKLRSLTQGRGTYSMEPFEYQPAPEGALDMGF